MKAEIISIGDELTSGSVQNTNATFIANQLHSAGIEVEQIRTVGDDVTAIVNTLRGIQNHIGFVIVTGGLGPTVDDITTKAAAEAMKKKLLLFPGT
ncbi:MAG: molybdopterin-binding protein [Thermodesulfobacteriota bacterium]|nr:molybdopterin-binding protein [Thermodesulfobacteriota bacterium]